MIMLVQHMIS